MRITPDDRVTIVVSQAELGQGISTTLPASLADELGARWASVKLATAPFAPAYRNPERNWMFTGNSESSQALYDLMRKTGAAAREMLVRAAAARWNVAERECTASDGAVRHAPSGRRVSFGALAADAAKLPVPQNPALRPASQLKLVGKRVPRVDVPLPEPYGRPVWWSGTG